MINYFNVKEVIKLFLDYRVTFDSQNSSQTHQPEADMVCAILYQLSLLLYVLFKVQKNEVIRLMVLPYFTIIVRLSNASSRHDILVVNNIMRILSSPLHHNVQELLIVYFHIFLLLPYAFFSPSFQISYYIILLTLVKGFNGFIFILLQHWSKLVIFLLSNLHDEVRVLTFQVALWSEVEMKPNGSRYFLFKNMSYNVSNYNTLRITGPFI